MKEELATIQFQDLIELLKDRFEKNMFRHENLKWANVQEKLFANTNKLWSLKGSIILNLYVLIIGNNL